MLGEKKKKAGEFFHATAAIIYMSGVMNRACYTARETGLLSPSLIFCLYLLFGRTCHFHRSIPPRSRPPLPPRGTRFRMHHAMRKGTQLKSNPKRISRILIAWFVRERTLVYWLRDWNDTHNAGVSIPAEKEKKFPPCSVPDHSWWTLLEAAL